MASEPSLGCDVRHEVVLELQSMGCYPVFVKWLRSHKKLQGEDQGELGQ